MKICAKCEKEKDISEFCRDKNYKDGRFYWCKDCCNLATRRYYENNQKKETARKRKHHAENREKESARHKKWAEANCDERAKYQKKYYHENRERLLEQAKKRYAENPEKGRELYARRRARILNAFVAEVNRSEIYKRDKGTCHICKGKVDPNKWHLDHIYPLSKGGTHEPDNVAVSHPECNMEKRVSTEFGGVEK